ncbi:MAG: glutathione S-transferase N-terminal domain-containing protein [Rhizobiales bacterium]|nr:glutathione S-transferase N-terminal domain-containing protein [Hyphomicrobiales bacterium]
MAKLKLYYSPGACSLASHMALEEAGADYEPVRINFGEAQQRSPDYLKINPKGRVPALVDGDRIVTENPAILRYVARLHPAAKLWPEDAGDEARATEWMAWISSTVHPSYAHIRRPERYATADAAKQDVAETAKRASRDIWEQVEKKLAGASGPWGAGANFSVADPYILVFWTWGRGPTLGYDMARDFPAWTAHARRMAERPAVKTVFAREGLDLPA